jgi:tetratricopeptide (TPR) repeat protein
MRPRILLVPFLLAALPGAALAASEAAWRALPAAASADSCASLLRIWESAPPRAVTAADATMARGQFHYARGEYRQAKDAFARASARTTGAEQGEARYWVGLSSLALGEGSAAREAFAEAAASAPARRELAQLGAAQAWDADRHPEKALDALRALLAGDPGEAGPAALERLGALAEQFHRDEDARQARRRLARDYPGSLEAARLNATPSAPAGAGPVGVQIGVFADRARAVSLAAQAKAAGFASVQLVERKGDGSRPTLWLVRLGTFATRDEANAEGEKAQRALGVGWQVMAP